MSTDMSQIQKWLSLYWNMLWRYCISAVCKCSM